MYLSFSVGYGMCMCVCVNMRYTHSILSYFNYSLKFLHVKQILRSTFNAFEKLINEMNVLCYSTNFKETQLCLIAIMKIFFSANTVDKI